MPDIFKRQLIRFKNGGLLMLPSNSKYLSNETYAVLTSDNLQLLKSINDQN